MKRLIAEGADVAAVSIGVTPLYVAAKNGHGGVVGELVEAGADINQALPGNGSTPMHAAAEEERADVIDRLVAAGADVNAARTTDGATPLHVAGSLWGHRHVAEQLIAAKADINKPRADGETPLDTAMRCRSASFAQTLKRAGAQKGRQ